jgi:DedD protein
MADRDTEITLGTGRLVALFFGLVAICGLFMGLGYTLGRSSAASTPASSAAQSAAEPIAVVDGSNSGGKQPLQVKTDAATQPEDMSFYKSVEQKEADAKLVQPENRQGPANSTKPAPPGSGYMVQVAAVSKQEDAEALVAALKRKQYAVVVATNPPTDRLYHVQIGPYEEMKEAEAIRTRLVGDGYNPILKR